MLFSKSRNLKEYAPAFLVGSLVQMFRMLEYDFEYLNEELMGFDVCFFVSFVKDDYFRTFEDLKNQLVSNGFPDVAFYKDENRKGTFVLLKSSDYV